MILLDLIIVLISILILLKSSEYFIKSSGKIAQHLNISKFIIGLTLVAIGTSLPELVTSIIAALENNTGIIIGNIVGSNIANIGLILGIGSILTVITVKKEFFYRDSIFLLSISLLFYLLSLDRIISWTEGIVFLLTFIVYIYILYQTRKKERYAKFVGSLNTARLRNTLIVFCISLGFLLLSAKFVVDYSVKLAAELGVRQEFMGLTLIAIGTSLPELAVTITAARKRMPDILLGNIIGSNIVNILLVIGISSLITPIELTTRILLFSLPMMLFITLLLLGFLGKNWLLRGIQGIIFLLIYILYLSVLIFLEL
ncbi:calcium/sodium antiporter [Candidatus Woesearchaeota archaeon]|nr:calcium/sodium antiporter [Candidatus Woesearchaeota archaeon]